MVMRLVVLLLVLAAPAVRADPDDGSSSHFDRLRDIDTGVQQDAGDDDEMQGLYGGDEDAERENDPFADEEATPEPETPRRSAEPTPAPGRRPLGSPRPSEAAPTMDRGGGGSAGGGAAKTETPTAPRGRAGAPPPTDQPRDDDGGPGAPIRGGRGGTTSGD